MVHLIMYLPVTKKSVKIKREQQQKLTGLCDAPRDGQKKRLQASLQADNTTAPSNTPSMAAENIQQTWTNRFFFLPQGGGAQECQELCK